jgi:hypothetical protein
MQYQITNSGDDTRTVIAVHPTRGILVADDQHPAFEQIVDGLTSTTAALTDDVVADLFDASVAVAEAFESVTERVSIANGEVYFDGDPADDSVANQIVRVLAEGGDARSLALFMEKVAANPSDRSREQLFDWLRARDFTITPDGNIIAYKGVNADLTSIHQGKAVVNGQAVDGPVPNSIGAVVEFPRSEVDDNPAAACSRGLHVGTFDYAEGFGRGTVLTTIVNPRDVVSVPSDSGTQKVRVCRYTVLAKTETVIQSAVYDWATEEALDEPDWLNPAGAGADHQAYPDWDW